MNGVWLNLLTGTAIFIAWHFGYQAYALGFMAFVILGQIDTVLRKLKS
jgi:hypothetical protein